jgi:hypothetical protein
MSYSDARPSWQPASFAEMGVLVPFTSPELSGARVRGCGRGLELTLPNPAGKRGIYILDPREMGRGVAATLHDRRLVAALVGLADITPASVRQAARQVARAGFAGRIAAAAAQRAAAAERRAALAMQLELLRLLVRQTGGGVADASGLDRAARGAILALAARTGQPAEAVTRTIDRVAALFAPVGSPQAADGGAGARHPAAMAAIEALLPALAPEQRRTSARAARAAALILSAARDGLGLAAQALETARALLRDVPALLTVCTRDPAPVEAAVGRLDWLLESWPAICLIWQAAAPGRRCAALNEMAPMVPFIPAEAALWSGAGVDEGRRQALRAEVMGFSDWRGGGLAQTLTARNEALRAQAA